MTQDDVQHARKTDERLVALIPDYYAPQHLILAEGEGARCVIDLWDAWMALPGQTTLLYGSTCLHARYTNRLLQLPADNIRLLPSTLELLLATREILPCFDDTARIYVAASSRVERLLYDMLLNSRFARERIMVEVCEPGFAKVTCATCAATMHEALDATITCTGCGARLSATKFFSDDSISFLGLPAAP